MEQYFVLRDKNFRIFSPIEYEDLCFIPICMIFKYVWTLHFFSLSNLYFCNFITGMLNFLTNIVLSHIWTEFFFTSNLFHSYSIFHFIIIQYFTMNILVNVYIHKTTLQNSWHHFVTMNNISLELSYWLPQ